MTNAPEVPDSPSPSQSLPWGHALQQLAAHLDKRGGGDWPALERFASCSPDRFAAWLAGAAVPTVPQLLRFAYVIDATVVVGFTDPSGQTEPLYAKAPKELTAEGL